MYDVTLRFGYVGSKVGVSTVGTGPNFVARHGDGTVNIEEDLDIVCKVGADVVRFWTVWGGIGLESDGEFVGFARTFVETRWRGDEIGDVDRPPDGLSGSWIVYFTCKLNGRIP
jgi:hypothetical protein